MASFFSKIEAALAPLAKNVERKLGEAYQIAGENLGFAKDVTLLPDEYLLAERRVAALRDLVSTLVASYPPPSAADRPASSGMSTMMRLAPAAVMAKLGQAQPQTQALPQAQAHAQAHADLLKAASGKRAAIARAGYTACDILNDEPFSATVKRYADACEQVSSLSLVRRRETQDRVVRALRAFLDGNFATCTHACDQVVVLRRRLDAAKQLLLRNSEANSSNSSNSSSSGAAAAAAAAASTTTSPTTTSPTTTHSHAEAAAAVAAAEDKFVAALQVASGYMRGILESTRLLSLMAELVRLEKEYHAASERVLADAETFMRDNAATHEAIYGSGVAATAPAPDVMPA